MNNKLIQATEAFLAALKDAMNTPAAAAAPARSGNRTPPTTSYRGGSIHQDLVDCVRRAVRVSREGGKLTKKDRNIMRSVIKKAKANTSLGIVNTNGVDVFTHNGA